MTPDEAVECEERASPGLHCIFDKSHVPRKTRVPWTCNMVVPIDHVVPFTFMGMISFHGMLNEVLPFHASSFRPAVPIVYKKARDIRPQIPSC